MDMILVKLFATALALSEVMTQPQAVKTQFDPAKDQDAVVQILRDGCAHMRKAFDIELINVDDLISTALDDPAAVGGNIKAFHGLNFADLNTAYKQFCKNETVANPVVDIGQVITFYNNAAADLPDPARLKGKQLPGMSTVLDGKGDHYADVFQPGNRRVWVPLADVPDFVQKAFIAAEDRRFYQHHGIDEHGIIRAFIGNLAESGRPQGGSTITQQVVKNLLVGDDVTYERKIREMIVASRLENTLSKNDILELYINSVYLGRGSWGIEMAARSYFGKSAKDLTLPEGAMLAGLLKGPSFYNPDRHPDRAKERLAYVLGRMQEDGVISAEQKNTATGALPKRVVYAFPHRDFRFQFRRLSRPRGQDRRRRQPDRANLYGALHHQRAIAARRRIGAPGRLGAVRNVFGPRGVSWAGSKHRRCHQEARPRRVRHAGVAAGAAGRASAAL